MLNLLVGLGNPGQEYIGTRHNVGFKVIDRLSGRYNIDSLTNKFHGLYAKTYDDLILFKPTTYVNNSGVAVIEAARFFKIPPERIFVFHDDLDLETGKIKIKIGSGNGGHNGLKSIDQYIGLNYWRVRVGISKPEYKSSVSDYVLKKFTKEQNEIINAMVEKIVKNIHTLIKDGKDKFLLAVHSIN
ncbi:MAG: aminoacyl-tRNA hydrolase [Candidatus Midichloria sp.]|nr:MAG: aminoacyl-tRNA hydrolase [Candidatus Midichloria sp.]